MMKRPAQSLCRLVALVTLCLSAAPAAEPLPPPPAPEEELEQGIAACRHEQAEFAAEVALPEQGLSKLGSPAPYSFSPHAPMPDAPAGHTAVVADGGLLYDNARDSVSYLGNVRLNDEHAQLRAAHRLYVRLPKHGKQEEPAAAETATAVPAATEPQTPPAPQPPADPKKLSDSPKTSDPPKTAEPQAQTPPAAPAKPAAEPKDTARRDAPCATRQCRAAR